MLKYLVSERALSRASQIAIIMNIPIDDSMEMLDKMKMFGEKAIPVFGRLTNHPKKSVREMAVNGLMMFMDNYRIIDHLENIMKDPEPSLRRTAVWILGETKCPSAIKRLIESMKDNDWSVREQVVYAMVNVDRKSAVKYVIMLLKDDNAKVRATAANALGDLGDPKSIDSLISCLLDKDENVRKNVISALMGMENMASFQEREMIEKFIEHNIKWMRKVFVVYP